MSIKTASGLNEIDGILGLSPASSKNGPSYVSYLYEQKIIDDKIIGFYIASTKD